MTPVSIKQIPKPHPSNGEMKIATTAGHGDKTVLRRNDKLKMRQLEHEIPVLGLCENALTILKKIVDMECREK